MYKCGGCIIYNVQCLKKHMMSVHCTVGVAQKSRIFFAGGVTGSLYIGDQCCKVVGV